jgi:hypothetical protein
MSRCNVCPVPCDIACGDSTACALAATGDPKWIRHVVGRATLRARSPMLVPEKPPATRSPSVAEALALSKRMRDCHHWHKATNCGCGINRCDISRGDRGRVGHHDCFECLRAQDVVRGLIEAAGPAGEEDARQQQGGDKAGTEGAEEATLTAPASADERPVAPTSPSRPGAR